MKHQTPDSMKFKKLQRRLGGSKIVTIGTLELLWISTQKNAPEGDIGKYTDEEIAIECDWEGDPGQLIEALVDTGWLDKDPTYRLIVHDWSEHCPAWVKRQLARRKKSIVTPSSVQNVTNDHLEATNGTKSVTNDHLEATPNLTQPNLTQPKNIKALRFDDFWSEYPKKAAKKAARTSYSKAVKALRGSHDDPEGFLIERAKAYAKSGKAKGDPRYVLNPTTWLNQGRYDDDPTTWETGRTTIGSGQKFDPTNESGTVEQQLADAGF